MKYHKHDERYYTKEQLRNGKIGLPYIHYTSMSALGSAGNLKFTVTVEDQNSLYNPTTGQFTAPTTGLYMMIIHTVTQTSQTDMDLYIDGIRYSYYESVNQATRRNYVIIATLNEGQTMAAYLSGTCAALVDAWIKITKLVS